MKPHCNFYLGRFILFFPVSAEDSLMFVDMVTELSALYNDVLESDVLDWSMKKLNQERHYCGRGSTMIRAVSEIE